MKMLNSPKPSTWQTELVLLTEAETFPHSQEDIACFERRIAAAKQHRQLIGTFTTASAVLSRVAMPSRIAA
jgi:hypothetical protein